MAGTNKLSDKKLKALQGASRDAPEMYADGEGLSVRASKQGQLSWVFSYRLGGRGSKLERLTLGRYPDLSLKAAREKREKCRQWLAGGLGNMGHGNGPGNAGVAAHRSPKAPRLVFGGRDFDQVLCL